MNNNSNFVVMEETLKFICFDYSAKVIFHGINFYLCLDEEPY